MSPEKRAAIVRILRGMKASNGFDAEVAAAELVEFLAVEDEVEHWKRKALRLGLYAANLRRIHKDTLAEVLRIIKQEGYAQYPDGSLQPSSEDVAVIEEAVRDLLEGGA